MRSCLHNRGQRSRSLKQLNSQSRTLKRFRKLSRAQSQLRSEFHRGPPSRSYPHAWLCRQRWTGFQIRSTTHGTRQYKLMGTKVQLPRPKYQNVNFRWLALGCIDAEIGNQIFMFHHFPAYFDIYMIDTLLRRSLHVFFLFTDVCNMMQYVTTCW